MKSKKLIQFEKEFDAIQKMKIFEEEVTNQETGKQDFIIFDIFIQGKSFVAQHIALTKKQDKSKKIAFVKVPIDTDFSMDENLQELHLACIKAICKSDYYGLPD